MEFNTHPVTLIVGGFCLILLIFLVTVGLSCSAYKMGHGDLEGLYHWAESNSLCK